MHAQRISKLVSNVHTRVQRGRRILEDHGNNASDTPTRIRTTLGDFLAVEEHLALRWHLEAAHDIGGRGLSTAGFADDTQGLSALDAHINAANRVDLVRLEQRSSTGVEGYLNVFELDDRRFGCSDHRLGFDNQSFGTHQFSS